MSDYAIKLSVLSEKKQKLLDEECRLIEKRKKEIGDFAEKFDLLTVSDAVILGLFLDAKAALKNTSEKITTWEKLGADYLKPKRNIKEITEARS